MKVRYTIDALIHIAAIHSYINERNPVAASRVIARIRAAAEQLSQTPKIGHTRAAFGTRESSSDFRMSSFTSWMQPKTKSSFLVSITARSFAPDRTSSYALAEWQQ
jgi:plasmid stabilization system protein ParE